MSSPCLLVTLFSKRTLGVCADLAAEAIPAFTDAGEFGAGEFTPGKQAGKHQDRGMSSCSTGRAAETEHLHPSRVGKIAGNAAHEAHGPRQYRDSVQHVGQPGLSRARRSCHRDRPTGRPWSRADPCLPGFWTASAMRVTSSGAMTERTTSQCGTGMRLGRDDRDELVPQ